MGSHVKKDKRAEYINYAITFLNLLILMRVLFISIKLEYYKDEVTNQLTKLGEYINISKTFFINITNPLVYPIENILQTNINGIDTELVKILAPIFVITCIYAFGLLLRYFEPHIENWYNKLIKK